MLKMWYTGFAVAGCALMMRMASLQRQWMGCYKRGLMFCRAVLWQHPMAWGGCNAWLDMQTNPPPCAPTSTAATSNHRTHDWRLRGRRGRTPHLQQSSEPSTLAPTTSAISAASRSASTRLRVTCPALLIHRCTTPSRWTAKSPSAATSTRRSATCWMTTHAQHDDVRTASRIG